MSDYLPKEVVLEILQRLLVKSLIRFRCISKSWNSLITTPAFINSHLSYNSSNSNKFVVRYCVDTSFVEHYKLIDDNNDSSSDQIQHIDFPCINHLRLIGSVNGLFCLFELERYVLWNPSIRKFITLPSPYITLKPHDLIYNGEVVHRLGFGFDPRTNDYKVVKIIYRSRTKRSEAAKMPLVEVYSLNEGSCPLVLSFDLGDEVFRVISVPNDAFSMSDYVRTSAIGGSLSLLCHDTLLYTTQCCSIWVMKEYGVVDSWTKQFTVNFNGRILLGLQKNGNMLVETRLPHHWEISSYDPKSKQYKNLGICGMPSTFCVNNYMENLVLVDKPNDTVSKEE